MEYEKLDFTKAPKTGYLLAYFRTGVVFTKYEMGNNKIKAEEFEAKDSSELLELHLFDEEKEYRVIQKANGEYLDNVIESKEKENYILEEMYLEEVYEEVGTKLKVENHITFDGDGMIQVENYRLAGVVGKEGV